MELTLSEFDSPPPAVIRVMVVDDHGIVRHGLRTFLGIFPDIAVVAEAADGGEAVLRIAQLVALGEAPDVVLMDLAMTPVDGVTAIRTIRSRWPRMAVLALTTFVDAARVQAALEAGVSGYVVKDVAAEELVVAIRAAHRGEMPLDSAVASLVVNARFNGGGRTRLSALTAREREVLQRVARGMTNADIAHDLTMSERTARTHVSNILQKLGVTSRTQAALLAVREGLD